MPKQVFVSLDSVAPEVYPEVTLVQSVSGLTVSDIGLSHSSFVGGGGAVPTHISKSTLAPAVDDQV